MTCEHCDQPYDEEESDAEDYGTYCSQECEDEAVEDGEAADLF
jgi:hypothetical protein